MSKTKCPRCRGPATMVSKAPRGESGDVVRCAHETTCVALTDAARDVETTHLAVMDAMQDFTRAVGKPSNRHADVIVPGYLYADLLAVVTEWKDAGQTLHDATIAHAAAMRGSAAA